MIKVMSFNIRYGLADDGDNRWDARKSLALARIQAFGPDVLGLQECRDDAQAAFVKTSLAAYDFYGVPRGGDGESALEMAPLLFRRSAFQLLQAGHFWLSENPQVAGSRSWSSTFARTVCWSRLVHRSSRQALVFVNTHLDYQPQAGERAAERLRTWLRQSHSDVPIIVTGDFNANKDSAVYRLLTADGDLLDAYRQIHAGGEAEGTFHDFGRSEVVAPIDWILVSDHFKVLDAGVDRSRAGHRFPSDHYPVTATLNWIN
jgi:endonuclease/exonuclease/phosphatase family metal-dependent hydrolase